EPSADLTWAIIRGALKVIGIQTRYFEIAILGVDARKNFGKNLTDGVAFAGKQQIYLAEASPLYDTTAEKNRTIHR
ncbi:hypothetical protein BGZ80_008853, partial [Entomortierella chlamydospora]